MIALLILSLSLSLSCCWPFPSCARWLDLWSLTRE